MVMRVVGGEAYHGGDTEDAGGFIGRASVEVVLSQTAHQTVAPEKKGQRLDNGGLAAIVGTDQHGMTAQGNVRRPHAPKTGDFQTDDMHFAISR